MYRREGGGRERALLLVLRAKNFEGKCNAIINFYVHSIRVLFYLFTVIVVSFILFTLPGDGFENRSFRTSLLDKSTKHQTAEQIECWILGKNQSKF